MAAPVKLTKASVALITGSSAGLGAETARALAASGVKVVVNYSSSKNKADALISELEKLSPHPAPSSSPSDTSSSSSSSSKRFIAIRADVSQRSEIVRLVSEAVTQMGRLDLVVSNHGWTRLRDFTNLDENVNEGDWDRCFNMNVKSHLFLFHAAKPHLLATGGSFITVASLAGTKPSGSSVAYSTTKAAQIHLVKSLAKISGPLRVNSISPGLMLTDWGKQFPEAKIQKNIDNSPLKRIAIVEDVAQQIVLLANCTSMTGTNILMDAGVSL